MKDWRDVERWLGRYQDLKHETEELRREATALRSEIDGLKAQRFSGMPSGTSTRSYRVEAMLDKITALERDWDERCREKIDALIEIDRAIEAVQDDLHRRLLKLRFIEGLSWNDVAEELAFSNRHLFRLKLAALDSVPYVRTCPTMSD